MVEATDRRDLLVVGVTGADPDGEDQSPSFVVFGRADSAIPAASCVPPTRIVELTFSFMEPDTSKTARREKSVDRRDNPGASPSSDLGLECLPGSSALEKALLVGARPGAVEGWGWSMVFLT